MSVKKKVGQVLGVHALAARDHTQEQKKDGMARARRLTRIVALPITGSRRALPLARGSDDIRVSRADDVNGGEWCGFTAAGNTSSVRNLDIDNVRAADSLTGSVMAMAIVIEKIKSNVGGGHCGPGTSGKSRVWTQSPLGPTRLEPNFELQQRFNKHFYWQYPFFREKTRAPKQKR